MSVDKFKYLVTGGCSFTMSLPHLNRYGWAHHLSTILDIQLYNSAVGSNCNEMIARQCIYQIEDLKTKVDTSEILVGVMWSGINRRVFYFESEKVYNDIIKDINKDIETAPSNPCIWPDTENVWYLVNTSNRSSYAKNFYKKYQKDVLDTIHTLEHVLRLQWYLEMHKINYFMTQFMGTHSIGNIVNKKELKNNKIILSLKKQINFANWLPVEGEYDWVKDNSKFPSTDNDIHPTTEQHKEFTENIIIPWLKHSVDRKDYRHENSSIW